MRLFDTFSVRTLVLCSALVCWIPAEGQSRLIGPSEPIVAVLGGDVILPCHLDPPVDLQRLTLEWARPDLRVAEYVHLYRNRREVPDMKLRSYVGRTTLDTDELRRGNMWLRIINVTQTDAGTYRCLIPKLKSPVKESKVQLVVVPTLVPSPETSLPPEDESDSGDVMDGVRLRPVVWILPSVVCLLLLLLAAVGGFHLIRRRQKRDDVTYDAVSKPLPL